MKDYTGLKNNKLTAISFIERSNNSTYWLFKCDCGNEKKIASNKVFNKNPTTFSCGCLKAKNGKKLHLYKKDFGLRTNLDLVINNYFLSYKKTAKARGLKFNISRDFLIKLTSQNCFYCGNEPNNKIFKKQNKNVIYKSFYVNGIDRLNNNIGYETYNCVPCCFICNRAKSNLSLSEFYQWIERLFEHKIKN